MTNPLTPLDFVPDGILFDLDGTLWNAASVTVQTWPVVLANHPDITPALPLTLDNICRAMGLTNEELGARFFPHLPKETQAALMKESCELENRWLMERGGDLYPGVLETLFALARRFPLFIVSNCQTGYIECFLKANGGGPLITDYECSGRTGMEKAGNLLLLAGRNGLRRPVFIGDTKSDSEAAEKADFPFIYARYGFGETYRLSRVVGSRYAIDRFPDLLTLLPTAPGDDSGGAL